MTDRKYQRSNRSSEDKNANNSNDSKIDSVTDRAVKTRYAHLMDMIKNKSKSVDDAVSGAGGDPLSLSLPVTPRSIDGYPVELPTADVNEMNRWGARELEAIENRINSDFLKG